jgi:hypothetical protein
MIMAAVGVGFRSVIEVRTDCHVRTPLSLMLLSLMLLRDRRVDYQHLTLHIKQPASRKPNDQAEGPELDSKSRLTVSVSPRTR